MTIQEIKDLVDKKIAGQGNQVDCGSALPSVLNELVDLVGSQAETIAALEDKTTTKVITIPVSWGLKPDIAEEELVEVGITPEVRASWLRGENKYAIDLNETIMQISYCYENHYVFGTSFPDILGEVFVLSKDDDTTPTWSAVDYQI